mmetsp:Transcript_1309/g.1836  ORF Transcript_1309/g.1836 Transcript_1309/m.1836 type:complete len:630 (-) Transcript_1309:312-2201(-)
MRRNAASITFLFCFIMMRLGFNLCFRTGSIYLSTRGISRLGLTSFSSFQSRCLRQFGDQCKLMPKPIAPVPSSRAALKLSTTYATPRPSTVVSSGLDVEEIVPIVVDAEINLQPQEEKLFRLLLRASKDQGLDATLRVAGGWVRDKLLEANNHWSVRGLPAGSQSIDTSKIDIDIALDTMMGAEFAESINDWLETQGRHTKTVAVVQRNPEKSKHLETATMKISGFSLDFVNLRTESYTDDSSRIPSMEIGCPAEDAFRRDLTINSLFYNVNTGKIEDYTRRGLQDLEKRVVRTPLPAMTTFLDDPLRVLRSIRFASRLGFTMSQSILDAASSREVHQALLLKVSRERIGSEIEGMMASKAPLHAFHLIVALGLGPMVFPFPPMMKEPPPPPMRVFQSALLHMTHMTALLEGGSRRFRPATEEERRLGLYAAFLWPFRGLEYAPIDKKGRGWKKKVSHVVQYMVQDMLKRPTRDTKAIEVMHDAAQKFSDLVQQRESREITRLELGHTLMHAGELWQVSMFLGLASDLSKSKGAGIEDDFDLQYVKYHLSWIRRYESLAQKIEEYGLVGCWDMKPLFDGNKIKELFPHIPRGPSFKFVMEEQVNWMLENANGTEDQCLSHLKERFPDYC